MIGFSGSQIFGVELPDTGGRFVLKRFHAATSPEHAAFVHGLVRHLHGECGTQVAEVMPALDGQTVVRDAEGGLWELSRFMPGVAVPCPTPSQAAAAAAALGGLHRAAASLPGKPPRVDVSPGCERRIAQARRLVASPWKVRRDAWTHAARDRMLPEAFGALDARVVKAIEICNACGGDACIARVATSRPARCVLQPVLRDVWYEHVLLANPHSDDVTAIIDLHAAGIESPAADLARLIGSWDSPGGGESLSLHERWPGAIAAYDRVRPLSDEDFERISFFHATGVVLGLDNWFRWTLEEHRAFPDEGRMLDRIDRLLAALPGVLALAGSAAGNVD